MKVLWIAQNGGKYKNNIVKGTGGWIGALQEEILKNGNVELGIVFPHSCDSKPSFDGKTSYFPYVMGSGNGKLNKLLYYALRKWEQEDELCSNHIQKAIEQFQPDIVHIWGIEFSHAAIIPKLKCPHVVHIQGLTSLYINVYIPPFFSVEDLKKCNSWFERRILHHGEYGVYQDYLRRAKREIDYSPYVKNWIGRTQWDYEASRLLSQKSNYYHGEEVMRNNFKGEKWHYHYQGILHIQSNISNGWYKGIDVILKTANILKKQGVAFEWNIYGVSEESKIVSYISNKLNINPNAVNVVLHGNVDGNAIFKSLLSSDVYVHPSYIENSSNAIAEAMFLGLPVIAQYVGGNPTMLKEGSGILVAPNEPYSMAYHIMNLRDKSYAVGYSNRAFSIAEKRQNSDEIISELIAIYQTIIDNQ